MHVLGIGPLKALFGQLSQISVRAPIGRGTICRIQGAKGPAYLEAAPVDCDRSGNVMESTAGRTAAYGAGLDRRSRKRRPAAHQSGDQIILERNNVNQARS